MKNILYFFSERRYIFMGRIEQLIHERKEKDKKGTKKKEDRSLTQRELEIMKPRLNPQTRD